MNKVVFRTIIATFLSGIMMWIIAGLWHNLILPSINSSVQAHHEGLLEMLLAYFILSGLMTYFYTVKGRDNYVLSGLLTGVLVGVLWVFPHGLTMAGVHQTPIFAEVKNALWHCIEQGSGGVIIALIKRREGFIRP